MGRFAEYQIERKIDTIAEACARKGISLASFEQYISELTSDETLTNEEVYSEILGTLGKWAGGLMTGGANLAGRLIGNAQSGLQAMGNKFSQGYNQGMGNQQQGQQPQQNQQNNQGGQQGQQVRQQLQHVIQMLGQIGTQTQYVNRVLDQLTKQIGQ